MTDSSDVPVPGLPGLASAVYRGLFERSPEAHLVQSLDGTILDCNEAAAALYGWPRSELIGRHYGAVVADYRDGDDESFAGQLRETGWSRWSGIALRRDGSTVDVEVVGSLIETDGHDLAVLHVADVSDSRAFAVALLELSDLSRIGDRVLDPAEVAHESVRVLVSRLGASAGAFVAIEDGRPRWQAAVGEIPGRELLDSHLASRSGELLAATLATEAAVDLDVVARAAEGRPLPRAMHDAGVKRVWLLPVVSGDEHRGAIGLLFDRFPRPGTFDPFRLGAIGRVVGTAVTNAFLRAEAIRYQDRYRTLFERSPVPLVLETLDGRVGDVNAAALALYGTTREWLVGRAVDDISDWEPGELARRRDAMTETGWGVFTGVGVRADGRRFPAEVHATWVEIDGERRVLVRVQDLTERERLHQELVQAQKMEAIGLLVSGVAHELNNPLASIVAFSQLIRTDPRLPDELHDQADMLIGESNRTRRIVQNLLDFARQRPPERVPTDLRPLVDSVIALQSYTFGPGRIEALVEIPDDIPPLNVDRAQIQQVLVNLTLNAAQAIRTLRDQGTIVIRASRDEGDGRGPIVRLAVTDDGPGVPEPLRSRLFVPFFTTKAPGEGTGLGLSVSFGIITAHGGSLRHEPGPDDRGSTFVIELPVESAGADAGLAPPRRRRVTSPPRAVAATEPAAATAAAGPGGRRRSRILVLDDEAAIRAFLVRALERAGHEPIAAADGATALEIVRAHPPDAILCDHRMAGMSGVEFHAAVEALSPTLARRFAFMSGDVLNPELREFATTRRIHLLAKPFDIESIDRTIAELLDGGLGGPGGTAPGYVRA